MYKKKYVTCYTIIINNSLFLLLPVEGRDELFSPIESVRSASSAINGIKSELLLLSR